MMTNNGYINATKLCSKGNKKFNDWSRLINSNDLINQVSVCAGIPVDEIIIKPDV